MAGAYWIFIIFFACLFINIPIAFSLGIATFVTILITHVAPITLISQILNTSVDSFTLLAIPFFVLAGDIMATGGISQRLVNFGKMFFGKVPGGLGLITVFSCAIFAAISGSGPATVAAIGGIMIPYMAKDKYEMSYAATLAAVGGTLGPIIPPSISFIVFGVAAGVSITDLFKAGIGSGVLIMISVMIVTFIVSKKNGYGSDTKNEPKFTVKIFIATIREAIWALLMPAIILGGIYGGVFTPTEAAVVACVYGLIVSLFVHKELSFRALPRVFGNSVKTVGSCFVLITFAQCFGQLLTIMRVPSGVTEFITGITDSQIVVLLLINVFLLIVGCFMDPASAILILTPLLVPIAKAYDVNLIHFGTVVVVNLVIGQVTPPVGVNLFIGSKIAQLPIANMFKWLPLFLSVLVADLMLITYIPQISLIFVK
jgi:C4-dicarboxylate transporter DctM subunit